MILTYHNNSVILNEIEKRIIYSPAAYDKRKEIENHIRNTYQGTCINESIIQKKIDDSLNEYLTEHSSCDLCIFYWMRINNSPTFIQCESEESMNDLFDKINSKWYDYNQGHMYVEKIIVDNKESWEVRVLI